MSLIELGKGVMLQGNKNLKYICASQEKEDFNRKFSFNSKCLIGKRYGTAFQIKADDDLEVIDPTMIDEHAEEFMISESHKDDNETKDNRNIEDIADSQNQKLSKEDIMSLQEEGVTGKEIIQELIENSSTFNERSEFSKAKYLQKKKKKYVPQFLALKPTARLLSQMYYFKNPLKILDVRPDTLGQILTWSNIHSASKVLVFENCQGLIAGAVLERLGTDGKLIQLYKSSFPVRLIMEQFNFSVTCLDENVCSLPLDKIEMLGTLFQNGKSDNEILEMMLGKNAFQLNVKNGRNVVTEEISVKPKSENVPEGRKRKFEKYKKRQLDVNRVSFVSKSQRLKESQQALSHLRTNDINSLIIVSKYHPRNVLIALLKLLPPSCPFVVYFPHKEPLMECYVALRELNVAINIELTESWFRNIQVLPNRTHPENVMSASGGYILHGIKIAK